MLSLKSNRKLLVSLMTSAQFLVLAAGPAFAAPVRFAGQSVFDINTAAGGMSATTRADIVQRNLDNALVASNDRTPAAVAVSYVKGQPVLTLGGFHLVTVDAASASLNGSSPAVLADNWANNLRRALSDSTSVERYVAQLTGASSPVQNAYSPSAATTYVPPANSYSPPAYTGLTSTPNGQVPYYRQGRVVYIPAGMTMSARLASSVSSQIAQAGDVVQAKLSDNINLGDSMIPAGSLLIGQVIEAQSGARLGRSGRLAVKFNGIRTTDGTEVPISAHILGQVGKFDEVGADQADLLRGENFMDKVKKTALGTAVGAGGGAALGTAVGAIAGGGRGVGRGAWSGAAIGSAVGAAQSLLVRKGGEVVLKQGDMLTLKLDAPASFVAAGQGLM